ncbi:MAG: helix-turn-helix transcriptional regulator, partial [Candidatus Aenigmarchaeota archaeon]|nr:helix-turn-helix transcriptional regulator [Candidatus Aenigmarchaeota archaeon]
SIISLLKRKGPKNVRQICLELGFEQSRVSHNLKSLVACGFVHSEWRGKNKVYALDAEHILPILDEIDKHISRYSERLERCGILKGKKSCQYVKEV